MKLVIIKAKPDSVPGLLKCINDNIGNIDSMKNCVHVHLQTTSGKTKERNARSDFYGITLPSFRKLRLIVGHGNLLKLSPNGRLILSSFNEKRLDEFKHQFGRLILEIDDIDFRVVSSIIDISKRPLENVEFESLVKELSEKGIETNAKDERLRKWLPFLKYVGLVHQEGQNLHIDLSLVNKFMFERVLAPDQCFEKILFEQYEKLESREGVYVPIYELRDATCNRLIDLGYPFLTFDFLRYFNVLLKKHSSMKEKKILLSEPGKREEEGIYVDKAYYYFISIYKMKAE